MLATISDTSLDTMFAIDERGRVLAWNPQASATFGWSREEAIGRKLSSLLIPKEAQAAHDAALARLGEGPSVRIARRVELTALHRDGHEMPVELAISSSFAAGRRVFHGIIRDLTDTRALQARLFQAEKFEALGTLAGSIAHDFNNIIAAINTFATLAIPFVSGGVRNDLDQVLKATERATRLTQQLLTFARQQKAKTTTLDLGGRIRELSPMLGRLAGLGVALLVDLPPEGPCVELDPSQLEQVVVNLVVNARDAMPTGGTLTIRASREGSEAVLCVEDTGHGIPEADRARIFEPFFTTKSEGRGTGLGLSTVLGVVEQNGGTISFDTTVREGSRFEIRFPLSQGAPAALRESDNDEATPGGGETVLLVEDDDLVRLACFRALDSAGYRVFEAHNAGEAIILAEDEPRLDLMVTDVALPRVDGRQLARHMNRIHPETKVLFVSGYNESDARISAIHAARAPFLAKPFTPHTLLSKVRETLSIES